MTRIAGFALLGLIGFLAGCGAVASSVVSCIPSQSGNAGPDCRSVRENLRDSHARDARRLAEEERGYRGKRAERAHREAIGPACEAGDPRACLQAAVFDERHGVARAQVIREYEVACDGGLGFGCLGVARLTESDPGPRARDAYVRACELGEVVACAEAATLAPERAVELHEKGCRVKASASCERAAFGYFHGAGAAIDRERAAMLAERGCAHGERPACLLRDEIAASR